jgi:glutaminyl-tRNA synthetase
MPSIAGFRRRGYTPESIRNFCKTIGVTKFDGLTDIAVLEHSIRDHLNKIAERRMAVLRPIKVVFTNYPEDKVEELEAINNPEDPGAGVRKVPFSKVVYIEREDFMENPPKKFFRLAPGGEVRLRYAYIIKCEQVIKDANGEITELHCTIDPDSKAGGATSGRKIKGTIHWVSAEHAVSAEVRLYDRLFTVEQPDAEKDGRDFTAFINPNSLELISDAKLERSLGDVEPGRRFQFERLGYFFVDKESVKGKPVFNRTVTLKDTWAKIEGKQ